MKERVKYIDFERGICTIFVVYIHLTFMFNNVMVLSFLHRLCIPQFALLIGYNINYSIDRPLMKSVLKSISKMVYIYFVALIFSQLVYKNAIFINEVVLNILTGNISFEYNIALWFIPYYISLFVIINVIVRATYFVVKCINKFYNSNLKFEDELLLIISIVLCVVGFKYSKTNYLFVKQALITQFFSIAGFIIYRYDNIAKNLFSIGTVRERIVKYTYLFIIILIMLICFVTFTVLDEPIDILPLVFHNKTMFYISTLSGGIFLFIISKMFCAIKLFDIFTDVISYIGKRSLWVCCLHLPIQHIILNNFKNFFAKADVHTIKGALIQVTATIAASIIISYAFEREKC